MCQTSVMREHLFEYLLFCEVHFELHVTENYAEAVPFHKISTPGN